MAEGRRSGAGRSAAAPASLAHAAVERSLATRRAASQDQAARLIDACIDLMQETQDLDPPVAAILRRAGLPTKALYRLFPSKTDLLLAVWEHMVGETVARIDEQMAVATTGADAVLAWVWALVERMGESAPETVPMTVSAASYAARLPDDITYPHPALLAPLEAALTALAAEQGGRGGGTQVGTPAETSRVVFDLVSHAMVRALVRRDRLSRADRALLERSIRRVVGLPEHTGPAATAATRAARKR
jgi:AcrR family transcriptional regulator